MQTQANPRPHVPKPPISSNMACAHRQTHALTSPSPLPQPIWLAHTGKPTPSRPHPPYFSRYGLRTQANPRPYVPNPPTSAGMACAHRQTHALTSPSPLPQPIWLAHTGKPTPLRPHPPYLSRYGLRTQANPRPYVLNPPNSAGMACSHRQTHALTSPNPLPQPVWLAHTGKPTPLRPHSPYLSRYGLRAQGGTSSSLSSSSRSLRHAR